jgi:hypothetical protein
MATFFNTESAQDINLLHRDVRGSSELDNMADRVEYEVIQFYKQRDMQGIATYQDFFRYEAGASPLTGIKVRLVGYNEADPEQSTAELKEALRRTIADILSYQLRNYETSDGIASQSQGNRSITFASGRAITWRDFPHGWNLHLRNYDARIQGYGI